MFGGVEAVQFALESSLVSRLVACRGRLDTAHQVNVNDRIMHRPCHYELDHLTVQCGLSQHGGHLFGTHASHVRIAYLKYLIINSQTTILKIKTNIEIGIQQQRKMFNSTLIIK